MLVHRLHSLSSNEKVEYITIGFRIATGIINQYNVYYICPRQLLSEFKLIWVTYLFTFIFEELHDTSADYHNKSIYKHSYIFRIVPANYYTKKDKNCQDWINAY